MRSRTVALHPGVLDPFELRTTRRPLVWLAGLLLAVAPLAAPAQDDLPGRVGRIAEFAGQVFLSPQDRATEWSVIGINYPVTTGDNLWVSGEGRAEIDYGGGQFRLAGDTSLHVSRLDDQQLALFVAQGRLIVRVRVLESGDAARVDTPNTQVTLTRPGLYRIDVTPDRDGTTVAVREGEALIALTSGAQQALPGQTLAVTGPEPAFADIRNGIGIDGFDSWSADRDRRYERGRSAAYVSRQMVGYAELDEYGTWEPSPTYGAVWYPNEVAADWAPYRDGYWTNAGSWGLTWVDAAPWGYAPSHYGRWVRVGPRWGWCPGAYVARPYWAPALVGWYGGGGWGLSMNVGAPVYGWVPLGWRDPYIPWWGRCSHNCWARYNRPYDVNVNVRPTTPPRRYSNFDVPGAMTVVPGGLLGTRKPVPGNIVRLPGSQQRSAPILASAPPVAPGPLDAPAVRPGERGTPPPASALYSRTWAGRDAAAPSTRPGAASAVAPAPAPRAGGQAATAPRGSGLPSAVSPGTPSPSQAITPPPPARRSAPPAATPDAGGTVAPVPPVRADGRVQPPLPRSAGVPVQAAPPPTSQTAPQPTPQRAGSPAAVSAANSGIPLPPQRPAPALAPAPVQVPVQAPAPVVRAAPAQVPVGRAPPAPAAAGRAAPAPSGSQPVAPVGAPVPVAPAAPVPQQRPAAQPADAATAAPGRSADKGIPGGGAVPR